VGILILVGLCSLFSPAYSIDENVKMQIEKLNGEIREAQRVGDEKAFKEALGKFDQLINENPELRDAFDKLEQTGNLILEHRNKAKAYFSQSKYDMALEEYQKILILTDREEDRKNFSMQRALVLIEIGKIHLRMGEEAFENAMTEKLEPVHKAFIEDKVRALKAQLVESSNLKDPEHSESEEEQPTLFKLENKSKIGLQR